MERDDRKVVATFVAPGVRLDPGTTVTLDEGAAHHARVRRLEVGEPLAVTDGAGRRAAGRLHRLSKSALDVAIDDVIDVAPPPRVELYVPVADRDRMLTLAEKAVELGVSGWTPVVYERSRSVTPRGEGEAFDRKLMARMVAALEQSHGAWLPEVARPVDVAALARIPVAHRLLLDVSGTPIGSLSLQPPVAIAVGPEGGITGDERSMLLGAGWRAARIAGNVMRFETAGIAALAIVRSALDTGDA